MYDKNRHKKSFKQLWKYLLNGFFDRNAKSHNYSPTKSLRRSVFTKILNGFFSANVRLCSKNASDACICWLMFASYVLQWRFYTGFIQVSFGD